MTHNPELSIAQSAKKRNSRLPPGCHLQYQPVMGFRELDLARQSAFRAHVIRREFQSVELHRLGRRKQMRGFGGDIDVAGGTNARATAFGENIVDCIALGRLHRALADFGGNFTLRSVRLDEDYVRHVACPRSEKLAAAVDDEGLAGDEGCVRRSKK